MRESSEIRNRKEEGSSGSQPTDYRISNNSCIPSCILLHPPLSLILSIYLSLLPLGRGRETEYVSNILRQRERERESSLPYNNIILVRGDVYSRCIEKILSIERERERKTEWRARARTTAPAGAAVPPAGANVRISAWSIPLPSVGRRRCAVRGM